MAQSALERNPDIRLIRALSMYPSVSVLTGIDNLDCQDLAGGREGRGLVPQQSCPVTFSFVPTGLVQVVRILPSVQFFSKTLQLLLQKAYWKGSFKSFCKYAKQRR